MKRALVTICCAMTLTAGLSVPAWAASPASCQGLAASSLAGEPGAFADERRDAFDEAADLGITPGALTSQFARSHAGDLGSCFG
jgi:hypothetical protein